jgi:hypothetical protein
MVIDHNEKIPPKAVLLNSSNITTKLTTYSIALNFLFEIGRWVDQNRRRHGRMAHRVETNFSQIAAPLGYETTINNHETS